VVKEEVIQQIKPNTFSLEKICSQCDDENRAYSPTKLQDL
jgi:hypothetical protein